MPFDPVALNAKLTRADSVARSRVDRHLRIAAIRSRGLPRGCRNACSGRRGFGSRIELLGHLSGLADRLDDDVAIVLGDDSMRLIFALVAV